MGENPDQLDVPILMANDVFQLINALPCSTSGQLESMSSPIEFYPQPIASTLRWRTSQPIERLTLHTITGEFIADIRPNSNSLSLAELSSGVYVCHWLLAGGASGVQRIVKE